MKRRLLILLIIPFLQGCSWIIQFFVANTTNNPVKIEIRHQKAPGSFPIFHYNEFYLYEGDESKVNWDKQREINPDTLENYAHFTLTIPAHSTLEIGRLNNDKYEAHNQYFINGRVFNLDSLSYYIGIKRTIITKNTFDNYFKKGKHGGVFYFIK